MNKRYLFVSSKLDIAGINLSNRLKEISGLTKNENIKNPIGEFEFYKGKDFNLAICKDKDTIFFDEIDKYFNYDVFIFLTRHESESKRAVLSAHTPGNLGFDSSYGGREREVAAMYPSLMKEYMVCLSRNAKDMKDYQVVLEPIHHGPSMVNKPVLFVEIGSDKERWEDEKAIKVVINSIIEAIYKEPKSDKAAIAIGGLHYSYKFTSYLLRQDSIPICGIVPKYMLGYLDEEMLNQIISKSIEKVSYAILDWKGLGQEKARISSLIKGNRLEVIKA
jgi:D-aminoacyl-tRNA deacylase